MIPKTTDELKSQFLRYVEKAGIREFWAKTGHTNFYKVKVEGENLIVQKTKKTGESGTSRKCIGKPINNGYEFLQDYCKNNDGGAFFGCSDGSAEYPLKKYQSTTTQVVVEIDNIPTEEQKDLYKWFSEKSGLIPYLISSGGKSIHLHLLLDKPTEIEEVVYLRRLLVLLLDGDPAVTRPHQPYRLPCFYRREKEAYQEIIQEGENYSLSAIKKGVQKAYKAKGYVCPKEISEPWWSHLQSVLNSDKGNQAKKAKPISKEEKLESLRLVLEGGSKEWEKLQNKKRKKISYALSSLDLRDKTNQDLETVIFNCLSYIPPRVPKTGTYEEYRSLFCAIKNIVGEGEAIDLAQKHSPAEKNWKQIIESSTGNHHIGTVVWVAKQYGYMPSEDKDNPFGVMLPEVPEDIEFTEFNDARYSQAEFEKDLKQEQNNLGQNLGQDDEDEEKICNEEKAFNYIKSKYGDTGKLRFNLVTSEIEFERDDDKLFSKVVKRGIRTPDDFYLELKIKAKIKVSKQAAYDLMLQVAQMNAYHPVEDYLNSIKEKPSTIDVTKLSTTLLGTSDPLFDEYLYRHLLGSVARIVDPGVKKDECLVLIGKQGLNKSSFFSHLYGSEFFDDSVKGTDKDDLLICHRFWCLELAELDYLTGKKATGEIKNFLSKSADSFRAPYARTTKYYKRGFVFCGSVNTDSFLKDETGNRRFWVIPVDKHIDLRQVSEYRDQIWAEIYRRYLNGESIKLASNFWIQQAEQVDTYREADPWESTVMEYVHLLSEVHIPNILESALGLSIDKHTLREQRRVAGILKSHGWSQKRSKSKRFWVPPNPPQEILVSPPSNPTTVNDSDNHSPNGVTLGTNVLSPSESLSNKGGDTMTLDDTRKTTFQDNLVSPEKQNHNSNGVKIAKKAEKKSKGGKHKKSSVIVSPAREESNKNNGCGGDTRGDTRNDIKGEMNDSYKTKSLNSNSFRGDTREDSKLDSKNDSSVTHEKQMVVSPTVVQEQEESNSEAHLITELIGETLHVPSKTNGHVKSLVIEAHKGGEDDIFICRNILTDNLIELPASSIFNLLENDINKDFMN